MDYTQNFSNVSFEEPPTCSSESVFETEEIQMLVYQNFIQEINIQIVLDRIHHVGLITKHAIIQPFNSEDDITTQKDEHKIKYVSYVFHTCYRVECSSSQLLLFDFKFPANLPCCSRVCSSEDKKVYVFR